MTLTPSLVLDEMSAARRGAAFTSPPSPSLPTLGDGLESARIHHSFIQPFISLLLQHSELCLFSYLIPVYMFICPGSAWPAGRPLALCKGAARGRLPSWASWLDFAQAAGWIWVGQSVDGSRAVWGGGG